MGYRPSSKYLFGGSHRKCSMVGGVYGVSRNSREGTCAGVSFLIKLQTLFAFAALLKVRPWYGRFWCGYCEISEGAFYTEHLRKAASTFYWNVLKIDLAIPISYWLLDSCVFWRYISPRGSKTWGLMEVFYFVFIILTVDGTGRILIKVSHWVDTK